MTARVPGRKRFCLPGAAGTAAVLLLLGCASTLAQSSARLAAAIGPFSIETARGTIEARLSRCDSNTLWVVREGAGGAYEAGIPLKEITRVLVPTPRAFVFAEQANTPDALRTAHEALDRLIGSLRPFRLVPGIPYYEALLQKARVYDRQGAWRDSLRLYEEMLKQPGDDSWKQSARRQAGIAYELIGEHQRAADMLEGVALPDDEEMLSSVLFSRGLARAALNRHREALMDFLYLVVFHPFVQNNELRGLDAATTCYVELKDWESLLKTIQWLQKEYPGTPEARRAQELYADHRAEMAEAAQFIGGEAPPATGPKPSSESEQKSGAGGPDAATIEDIEVD